jgi:hypothetical protein
LLAYCPAASEGAAGNDEQALIVMHAHRHLILAEMEGRLP